MEIERKFLVEYDARPKDIITGRHIRQGYVTSEGAFSLRVRLSKFENGDETAELTLKKTHSARSRYEYNFLMDLSKAQELYDLCVSKLEKVRYEIPVGNHTWEVDEFRGSNFGLVLAEIELKSEDETFVKPDWVGVEVTGWPQYLNQNLAKEWR